MFHIIHMTCRPSLDCVVQIFGTTSLDIKSQCLGFKLSTSPEVILKKKVVGYLYESRSYKHDPRYLAHVVAFDDHHALKT